MRLKFKEWLLSTPHGAGEIWDNGSNADRSFGVTGAKSKNFASDGSVKVNIDPDKLFLGKPKKKLYNKINNKEYLLGGNYGTNQ